jgi:hypothetical protein
MKKSKFSISPQYQAKLERLAVNVIDTILDASEGGSPDQETAKLYMGITMFVGILTTHEAIVQIKKEGLK